MSFEFDAQGRVFAADCVKGIAINEAGFVPNAESCAAMGVAPFNTDLPEPVRDWIAVKKGVMAREL